MPTGVQVAGGIVSQTRLAGGIQAATKLAGAIRRENVNYNVVLILIDDGGAEKFNWSGLTEDNSGFALTPRLDEMRTRGVAFLRGYANPICGPSRGRVLSGRYAFRDGLGGNIEATDVGYSFGGSLKLLPKALRLGRNGTADQTIAQSYSMLHVGKVHLCADTGVEGWSVDVAGFSRHVGMQPNAGSIPADGSANIGHFHFREITHAFGGSPTTKDWGAAGTWPAGGPYVAYDTTPTPDAAWDAYKVYRDAIGWINTRTTPFLALICFNPPHAPFETPPYTAPDDVGAGAPGGTFDLISSATQTLMNSFNGGAGGPGFRPTDANRKRQVFLANMEAVDSLIGKLWDRMDQAKRDNTVFILVGDNGSVSDAVDSPYVTAHAKRTIYEMGARIPFIVYGPPSVITSPGRTCDHLVHLVDVMPTVLELTLADPLLWNPGSAQKTDGKSFARVLRDPAAPAARDHVYNEIFLPLNGTLGGATPIDPAQWIKSYNDGAYKLIQKPAGQMPLYELYRIDSGNQPASGQPGYLELASDNLYGQVGIDSTITARFNTLLAAMNALLAS